MCWWSRRPKRGFFLAYDALLQAGDHVIVEAPCYESAITVARGIGASVSRWQRQYGDGWAHELSARDAVSFTLESWGESETNSADYLELGFRVLESEPIVAWNA